MPTDPIPKLLKRDLDKDLSKTLEQFATLIEETVNFGTHVFTWVGKATKRRGDEALVVVLFFRNALEILDSISVLVRASSVDPAGAVLLRALLETCFSAEYVISGITPQDRMKRARCYCVWDIHNHMKLKSKFDASTPHGKQMKKELSKDIFAAGREIVIPENIQQASRGREKLLQDPKYKKIEKEYQRIRRLKQNPRWYELFDGPESIRKIAENSNKLSLYEVFYRSWSGSVHGTGLLKSEKMSVDKKGKGAAVQMRLAAEAQPVTENAVNIALMMYDLYLGRYTVDKKKDMAEWYKKEIRAMYLSLFRHDFITYIKE